MLDGCYVPDIIPETDQRIYEKSGLGKRIGFGRRAAVIVVDMTHVFVEEDSPWGSARTGKPAAQAIRKVLDKAREIGIPVIYTKISDSKEYATGIVKTYKEKLPSIRPEGAHEVIEEIAPKEDDIVITKPKPSAFFGTPLLGILTYYNVDTIVVTGMVTSGCIRATVVDGFSYNFRVIVPLECVADRGEIPHKASLFDMDMKYADVMSLAAVLSDLDNVEKGIVREEG